MSDFETEQRHDGAIEDSIDIIKQSRERQRKNVERGVKLLDEEIPDWRERITYRLSMNICADCVLGQVFNIPRDDMGYEPFMDALAELGIGDSAPEEYGFDIEQPDTDSYGDLETIWEEHIHESK